MEDCGHVRGGGGGIGLLVTWNQFGGQKELALTERQKWNVE